MTVGTQTDSHWHAGECAVRSPRAYLLISSAVEQLLGASFVGCKLFICNDGMINLFCNVCIFTK